MRSRWLLAHLFVFLFVCIQGKKKSICVGKKEIGNENGWAMYREGGRVGSWEIGFTLVKEIFDGKRNWKDLYCISP